MVCTIEESIFDDQNHRAHVKFIKLFVHHRVIVIINCSQLYEITVLKFMQQLKN